MIVEKHNLSEFIRHFSEKLQQRDNEIEKINKS